MSGPCTICGKTGYEPSLGGPDICPACDCGHLNPMALAQHNAKLTAELKALKAAPASPAIGSSHRLEAPEPLPPSVGNETGGEAFQSRVEPWMKATFGDVISFDRTERADRLLEEVFELLQSGGYDPSRIATLRDYTWGRPPGEPAQEVGGVMVTLAAYCLAFGLDMHEAGETELARIWTKVEAIRAKQAAKPRGIALPIDPAEILALPNEPAGGWRPPEGYVIVPDDVTPAMVAAATGQPYNNDDFLLNYDISLAYRSMIAARPPLPAPPLGREGEG